LTNSLSSGPGIGVGVDDGVVIVESAEGGLEGSAPGDVPGDPLALLGARLAKQVR
jgi:hypothetical protein